MSVGLGVAQYLVSQSDETSYLLITTSTKAVIVKVRILSILKAMIYASILAVFKYSFSSMLQVELYTVHKHFKKL